MQIRQRDCFSFAGSIVHQRMKHLSSSFLATILLFGLKVEAAERLPNVVLLFADDLREAKNLATTQPSKLDELKTAWEKMNAEIIEPVWLPRR